MSEDEKAQDPAVQETANASDAADSATPHSGPPPSGPPPSGPPPSGPPPSGPPPSGRPPSGPPPVAETKSHSEEAHNHGGGLLKMLQRERRSSLKSTRQPKALLLRVMSAAGLAHAEGKLNKDGSHGKDTSDPYAKVILTTQAGVVTVLGKTAVVDNSLDPVWNHTFEVDIPRVRVQAKCLAGQGDIDQDWLEYYWGEITKVNPDGTYAMLFDDGEEVPDVKASQMKKKDRKKALGQIAHDTGLAKCEVTVEVHDSDAGASRITGGADDFLGRAVFPLDEMIGNLNGMQYEHKLEAKPKMKKKDLALVQGKIRVAWEHKRETVDNGKLVVNLCSGEELVSKDVGGDSDSFCVLRWQQVPGAWTDLGKTPIIKDTPDPVWVEQFFACDLPNEMEHATLEIDVFDHDLGGATEFLGNVTLTGPQILKAENGSGGHEVQFKLRGRRGIPGSSNYRHPITADKGVTGSLFIAFKVLDRDESIVPKITNNSRDALKSLPMWTEVSDPTSGDHYYYYNHNNQDDWTWDKPDDFMPKFDIDGKSIALGLAHPRLVASVAIQSRWRVKLAKRRLALLRDPDAVEAAWEQYTDAQGYPYWYNTLTHESTYEKPLGFKLPGEMTDEEKQQAADRVARESEKARLETERLAAEKAEREADDNDKKAAEMIFQSLLLRVKSAAGLASADTFGKSDPYCKVFLAKGKFGDVLEIGRTVAVDNTANPEWDAMFELKLPEDLSTCTLTLEVFDEDAGITNALNKDDFLGRAVLGVGNIFEQDHTGGVCEHLLGPKPDLTKKQMKLVKGSVSISLEQKLNVEPNGALVVDIISASNVITDKLTKDQPSCAVNWRPVPGDYELVGTEKAVKASPNLEWEASFECGLPNDVRSADMILTLTQPRRMKQDLFLGTVALTGVDVLDYANRDTREYTLLGKDGVADKPRGSISLRFRTLDRDWATAPRALKPALPRWTRVKDPATGDCFYYFNGKGATVETGDEWSWERPQDFGWGGGDVVEGGDGGGSADNSGEAKDEREADDPGKEGKVDNKVGNDDDEEEGTEDTEDTTGPLGTGLCHPRLWASVRLEAWWRAHMLHMRTTRVFTKAGMAEARARERAKKAGLVWTPELARQVLPLHKKVKWPQAKKMGHLQSFALDPEAKPDLSSYASVNFLQTFGVDLNLPDKAPPTGMDYNFWQKDEEETKIAPKKPDKVRGELPMDIARAFFKDAAQYRANNRVKDDEAFTEFKDRYGSMVNGMAPQPALKRSAIHPSQVKNIQRVTQLLEAGGLPARYEPLRMPPGGWGDDESDHSSMDSDDLGVNDFTRNFGY